MMDPPYSKPLSLRLEKKFGEPNGALQKYAKSGTMKVPLSKKVKLTHDTYLFVYDLPEKDITLGLGVGHHIVIQ